MDSKHLRKEKKLLSRDNWDKILIQGEETIFFQQLKYARAITAVAPGQLGRVYCEGVSWRARCEPDVAIAPGEGVLVVGRHTPTLTLLVVPVG